MKTRSAQDEYGVLLALTSKLEYAVAAFANDVRRDTSADERARALAVVRAVVGRTTQSLQRYRRKALEPVA